LPIPDERHFPRELVEPDFDGCTQSLDVLDLGGIVRRQTAELVDSGDDLTDGLLMIGEETRPECQQVTARRTLGAADFEQQGVGLILDLDGVHDPGAVTARLVHQQHRGHADPHEHQESRREKQDLSQRTPPAFDVRRHGKLAASSSRI